MATSSAYKPGWRSRRRSRLSLVERAVPRLGRVAVSDDQPKPNTSSALLEPSTFESGREVERDDQNEIDLPLQSYAPPEEPAQQSEAPPLSLTIPSSPPLLWNEPEEQSTDGEIAPSRSNDAESETAALDDDAEIELGTNSLVSEKALPPEQKTHEDAWTHLVPVPDEPSLPETDKPEILPKVIEGSWDIKDTPAVVDAGAEKEKVQLDWETLLPSGLVDPRDRARPLPANMDEIARALVRQALSDQSSWRDRVILVSSARESRAKSMAALNFAFALTTIDRHSVVLLDANMDGRGAGRHVGVPSHVGLTTALCDSTVEIDEIALETNLDRLTLVASGAFEDDILDRFASRRMLEILRFLTKDPETLLVLDAPPILSSQEAAVLSVIAGQVVLVVEAGTTEENSINQALKRIGERHNLSLVLSDHAGIAYDEPAVEEGPSNDELSFPVPRKSASKRRLRRAVASTVVGLGFGLSTLLLGYQLSSDLSGNANLLIETSGLDRSTFKMKPHSPQTSSVVR